MRSFVKEIKKRIYQRFRDFNEIKGSHVMVANIHKIYRSRDKAIDVRNNLVALFLIDFIHQQPQRSSSGKPSWTTLFLFYYRRHISIYSSTMSRTKSDPISHDTILELISYSVLLIDFLNSKSCRITMFYYFRIVSFVYSNKKI